MLVWKERDFDLRYGVKMSLLVANLTSHLPSSFANRLLFGASDWETGNYLAIVALFYNREIDRAKEN